jgi:hypothetical protein
MLYQTFQIYYTFWVHRLFIGKKKAYPWWGQNALHQVVGGWDQEKKKNHELHSLS